MRHEEQLRARAQVLGDTSGLVLMVTAILAGASRAGVDPHVVPGLQTAIQVLSEGQGPVSYEAGRKTDRYANTGYSSDVAFLEAIREAADAIREHREAVRKLAAEVADAYDEACEDLAQARRDLADAYAMSTDEPCDGCHGRKRRAIAKAEADIRDAKERIDICVETAEELEVLFKRLQAAYLAVRRVPSALGEVYELIYAFVEKGGKMPHAGRWIEGASA